MPHKLERRDIDWADVVVAACDGVCPVVSAKRYENWDIAGPVRLPIEHVRPIRDEIARRVGVLVGELG